MPGGTSIWKGPVGSSEILNYTLKETQAFLTPKKLWLHESSK